MATFTSIQMTMPRYPVSGPGIGGRNLHVARGEFNLSNALAVNDVINMVRLHRNFRVESGWIKTTGLGAGTLVQLGDAGNTSRYFVPASSAAASTNTAMAETGRDYLTPAFTDVLLTVTGAATGTTGQIVVTLFGSIEEPA